MKRDPVRWVRWAAGFELAGILFEILVLVKLTPLTFFLFAVVGAGLVIAGMLCYLVAVFDILKRQKAL